MISMILMPSFPSRNQTASDVFALRRLISSTSEAVGCADGLVSPFIAALPREAGAHGHESGPANEVSLEAEPRGRKSPCGF